ncbi:glycoside hydrolase family 2 TIM barrel-domain containing protein [Aureibaculum conchae]|uniref:glycoside hydrolase family 2 TIM barrel-domain containing protein n=1 Tax=Aureibaculum sp. 2308TA14-22 TaxID=3108392 RepID=UPI003394ADB3
MRVFLFINIILCVLISCANKSKEDVVSVYNRQILVNEKPYLIKGICYHPVPKGSNKRDFSALTQDLALMVEAGINTIRVYEPIEEIEVLDEIHESGIKVIIGFGYNQKGKYDIRSGSFINYVNKFKNHKAILLWELGNEYNYHPEWFENNIKNWYQVMNAAADLIHKNDSTHPTSTAHGELPDALALSMSPNIDVWGMNVYRWDNPKPIFKQWEIISEKPMYLSEAGGDSYMTISKDGYEKGDNEKAQADGTTKILNSIFESQEICSGVTLFSFTDGWWKAGNNKAQDIGGWAPNSTGVPYDGTPNEEYWGIVNLDRTKKKVFTIVKEKYINLNKKDN